MKASPSPQDLNYQRVAQAIAYIQSHAKQQPDLLTISNHLGLSPGHFQKIFTQWAGVSPKKFLKFLTLKYTKSLLRQENQPTLFEVTHQAGLSSTSRLHELFIQTQAMSAAEYKNQGLNLRIAYSFHCTLFGTVLIASTDIGICSLRFFEKQSDALRELKDEFPKATFTEKCTVLHQKAITFLQHPNSLETDLKAIKLHLKGSEFQFKVWQALLDIPVANLQSYKSIAQSIGSPSAHRAVGTAIGKNPIAFLIPCHRVIQSTGALGGYRWGLERKGAIIGWEASTLIKDL